MVYKHMNSDTLPIHSDSNRSRQPMSSGTENCRLHDRSFSDKILSHIVTDLNKFNITSVSVWTIDCIYVEMDDMAAPHKWSQSVSIAPPGGFLQYSSLTLPPLC